MELDIWILISSRGSRKVANCWISNFRVDFIFPIPKRHLSHTIPFHFENIYHLKLNIREITTLKQKLFTIVHSHDHHECVFILISVFQLTFFYFLYFIYFFWNKNCPAFILMLITQQYWCLLNLNELFVVCLYAESADPRARRQFTAEL